MAGYLGVASASLHQRKEPNMADQYAKVAVGEKLYVWTKNGQDLATNDECVISSHGGQSMINSGFVVGTNQEVVFYCPHGNTLACDVGRLVRGPAVSPNEVFGQSKR